MNATTAICRMCYKSPFGFIECVFSEKGLISSKIVNTEYDQIGESTLMLACKKELNEYFTGKRITFDIPLDMDGTEFQQAVWNAVCNVPAGETWNYQDISNIIGKPTSARAVGQALNKNPICIFIPCHRVIASDGSIGGYAFGNERKQSLLRMEKVLYGNRFKRTYQKEKQIIA